MRYGVMRTGMSNTAVMRTGTFNRTRAIKSSFFVTETIKFLIDKIVNT